VARKNEPPDAQAGTNSSFSVLIAVRGKLPGNIRLGRSRTKLPPAD